MGNRNNLKSLDKCKIPLLRRRNKMHIINQYNYVQANTEFIFTINTALGTGASFILPLPSGQTYNFTVDYGDGSPLKTVIAYNDPNASYTYSMHGIYQIKVKGKCGGWSFNNGGDKLKITSVDQWGDVEFDYLVGAFYGCSNLASIPNSLITTSTTIEAAQNLFRNCSSLSVIPSKIFDGLSTTINNLGFLFAGCTSITSIPSGLFDSLTSYAGFNHIFNGCTNLTTIPIDLFRYCISATQFSSTFIGCTSLTSIPTDIFRYNTLVINFSETFRGCTSLSSLPENLFYYNNNVTNYNATFWFCRNIVLPSTLFNLSNLSIITLFNNFMSTSSTTYSNTGTIQDIWNYATSATSTNAFLNQTSLSNYASIPNGWKGL